MNTANDETTLYEILTEFTTTALEREVTKALLDGWVLQGGVSMAYDTEAGCMAYAQAVYAGNHSA